jgi:hypothetical protein
MAPDTTRHVASILNDWWMVRHYVRGGRSAIQKAQRQEAIRRLGLTIRDAFNSSEDFEPLLAAVLDGGRPRDEQPF